MNTHEHAQVLVDSIRPAYLRPGGMHRRYYSLENLQELAAAAGVFIVCRAVTITVTITTNEP